VYGQRLIRLLHFSIFVLICLSVAFCLITVLRAQAWLNQQAELSVKPIEAKPQASTSGSLVAAHERLRFAEERLPLTTLIEIGHAGMGAFSQEYVGSIAEDVGPEALAKVRPDESVRSERSPGPVQRITPGLMSAEGKKADDDVRFASVSVHRFGGKPTLYRVPRE
jgi:hypothetical protein